MYQPLLPSRVFRRITPRWRLGIIAIGLSTLPAFAANPTVTSFTPQFGAPGSSVTISGTNFSTTASADTVTFGGVAGTVTAAAPQQLTVTVPSGALSGVVGVT